ncbi:MAG: helix-turn-helix transcriptional regulator [Ruminococcus sp.]|nr:helix-turn-helix transcriptional regulator [Ruminococcus sp.]
MYGQRIKELREGMNLSQLEFANALGDKYGEQYRCTQNSISKYEKELREPKTDLFIKIADFFGVTTDYIFGIDDEKNTSLLNEVQRLLSSLEEETLIEVIKYVQYLRWREDH